MSTKRQTQVSVKNEISLLMACLHCLLLSLSASWLIPVRAQEEKMPELIETFTLDTVHPQRVFLDGKLKVALVSSTENETMKTIVIRVSSDALMAEYGQEWREHSFIEMIRYFTGDPISGSPFKCLEGWIYYQQSAPGSVTLTLHKGNTSVKSAGYWFTVNVLRNWKYFIMFLGIIGIAIALYYWGPLLWGFISIQVHARAHALATGFDSSPVVLYVLKKIPLLACIYLFFHLLFNYGWKGAAGAVILAIGLQLYFNWHNRNQLIAYAEKNNMSAIEGTNKCAFKGEIRGIPVLLSVGGIFIPNVTGGSDFQSVGQHTYLSFLLIRVTINDPKREGLILLRDKESQFGWKTSGDPEIFPEAEKTLTALADLPKYSIGRIEVIDSKLSTVKAFAADSPAEIHLLTDLMVDLARALDKE